jgi:virginiamycin B lyase
MGRSLRFSSRALGRLAAVAAALAAVLAVSATDARAGAAVGMAQGFPTKCNVGELAAGKEGNVWFTCFVPTLTDYEGRPRIGRVTPAGQVSEFGSGLPKNEEVDRIVAAANGELWFSLNSYYLLFPGHHLAPGIGRITLSGQITVYRPPLGAKYDITDLVASPSGYLWFSAAGPEAREPSLWEISPLGEISRLPVSLGEKGAIALEVGPEGNLWFAKPAGGGGAKSVIARLTPAGELSEYGAAIQGFEPSTPLAAPDGSLQFLTGGTPPTGIGRITQSGEITTAAATLAAGGEILGGTAVGADGNLWFALQVGGTASSIGRVTASGQVTKFRECLRYGQPYFGPDELVLGADGNLWFTSIASRMLPSISDPPSVGRITPSGEITQIYAGVKSEPKSIAAGPDGAIWFSGGGDEVQRIAPFSAPVNTFRIGRTENAAANGATKLRLTVPGPGKIEARPVALLLRHHNSVPLHGAAVSMSVPACGAPDLPLRPVGPARRAFRRRRMAIERVAITFTPAGGTPYTETGRVVFYRPHSRR